jgi:hypothetical protein
MAGVHVSAVTTESSAECQCAVASTDVLRAHRFKARLGVVYSGGYVKLMRLPAVPRCSASSGTWPTVGEALWVVRKGVNC